MATTPATHVVVLGGTGFVGRPLVQRLLDDGARVTVLSRGPGKAPAEYQARRARLTRDASLLEGDVHDVGFLRAVLDDADAVVNLVGILNEKGDSGEGFERVFTALTRSLLTAMHDNGVRRLLQMSALHAGKGESHYLQARGHAEREVRASRLDWTLFQPSVIAGPGDGLFCRFDGLLRFAPVLPVGRADAKFQPVWIGDVVEAFARALGNPASIHQTYPLVGPDVLDLADIIRLTARARGRHRLVLPLPDALGRLQANVGEFLPGKPISRDNWRSLQLDSVSIEDGLARLGITATPVVERVPAILGLDEAG
ncbi:complex I NDUFA9 subunit family protein [Marilutibacter spongiae]|uniref:Complex I NDUFA9 subunit family protein n=1 Tax=Marilutibacter spongiae TaxID=2025720 RepID=A0A7W3Y6P0_9GAMM|nr:complex I NDUFA9 subunit family protein [Lysobacter spongiae]MBB1061334.1 complex I NDUFA9 subunit family protein [Lysobacter spongiae]